MTRRRPIAAFFLMLVVMPVCWFLQMEVRQRIVRHEMMERLEKTALVTLHIPVPQVQWYKKNKEIMVQGEMFDIKSYREEHGVAIVTGLFDEKETKIKKSVAAATSHNKQTTRLAGHCIYLFLICQFDTVQIPEIPVIDCNQHFHIMKIFWKSVYPDTLLQPPRMLTT